jgi:hypothetical protein
MHDKVCIMLVCMATVKLVSNVAFPQGGKGCKHLGVVPVVIAFTVSSSTV